jgi:hypothetical protein
MLSMGSAALRESFPRLALSALDTSELRCQCVCARAGVSALDTSELRCQCVYASIEWVRARADKHTTSQRAHACKHTHAQHTMSSLVCMKLRSQLFFCEVRSL